MTTPTPTEADKRAAEEISEITNSRSLEEFGEKTNLVFPLGKAARIIADHHQPERDALRLAKEALAHISKVGHDMCKQQCTEDYIPRGRHAPECPNEYYLTADDALAAIEKVEG